MYPRRVLTLLLHLLWLALSAAALAGDVAKDVEGAGDIPGIPRDEASAIIGYRLDEIDGAVMPAAKWDNTPGARFWEAAIRVEGRRTRILYLAPKGRSSQEVLGHYTKVAQGLDYQTLFECAGFEDCGKGVDAFYSDEANADKLTDPDLAKNAFSPGSVQDPRLYVGAATKPEGESYLFVFAAYQRNDHTPDAGDRVAVFVEEVLTTGMEEEPVTVEAEDLEQDIDTYGRVAIYGIYFDAPEAAIKPESRPQMEEMAKLLRARPELAVYIVGHTDNEGIFDDNMALSKRRAAAVAAALAKDFGIAAERMTPLGVANLAPMMSNTTAEGRAMNRRVEMVANERGPTHAP